MSACAFVRAPLTSSQTEGWTYWVAFSPDFEMASIINMVQDCVHVLSVLRAFSTGRALNPWICLKVFFFSALHLSPSIISGIGCNAEGKWDGFCRYCGFGPYSSVSCNHATPVLEAVEQFGSAADDFIEAVSVGMRKVLDVPDPSHGGWYGDAPERLHNLLYRLHPGDLRKMQARGAYVSCPVKKKFCRQKLRMSFDSAILSKK